MDNRLVDRRADDARKRPDALNGRVALEVGGRPVPLKRANGERIERRGGDPRLHGLPQPLQDRHDHLARAADARNLCSAVIIDRHAAVSPHAAPSFARMAWLTSAMDCVPSTVTSLPWRA